MHRVAVKEFESSHNNEGVGFWGLGLGGTKLITSYTHYSNLLYVPEQQPNLGQPPSANEEVRR